MTILKVQFAVCSMFGYWRPINCTSRAKWLYRIYSFYMTSVLFIYVVTGSTYIIITSHSVNDFTEGGYMMLSIFFCLLKMIYMIIKYDAIIDLRNMLLSDMFQTRNYEEAEIISKYEDLGRWNTLKYALLTDGSITFLSVTSFMMEGLNGRLMYNAYFPFDYTANSFIFWIIYIHQVIGHVTAGNISIGADSVVSGFMLKACAQIDIMKYRLGRLSGSPSSSQYIRDSKDCKDEENYLANIVQHHNYIYHFCEKINEVFAAVVFFQFSVTIIVICSSLYQMAVAPDSKQSSLVITYLPCMLIQIFIYCWSGNEVALKSQEIGEAVFSGDWNELNPSTKKNLILIMARTKHPIVFNCFYFVTPNINSFVNILKTSYSIYNVLSKKK